jgi:hypothetical protein
VQQSQPTIDSLKEMKLAALNIEANTNEFGFTPGVNRDEALQELTEQKNTRLELVSPSFL